MDKKVYILTDGSGEIFDARFMDQGTYEDEQRKADGATDGTYWWVEARRFYAAAAGSVTSERKAKTSAENGKLGGRPAKIHYRKGQDVSKQAEKAYYSDEPPF